MTYIQERRMIVNIGRCRDWKENASVSSEYLAGIVTETFLASETEPQRLSHRSLSCHRIFFRTKEFYPLGCLQPSKFFGHKPYVCTAEGEKPC